MLGNQLVHQQNFWLVTLVHKLIKKIGVRDVLVISIHYEIMVTTSHIQRPYFSTHDF